MAAVLTGTPTAVAWAAGANPAGQSITIPSDCTAVYMFWAYYNGSAGNGLLSATLNSASPSATHELATASSRTATGVSIWYNPATGSRTLDVEWDTAPAEGPVCIVAYVKGGDLTAPTDVDSFAEVSNTASSVTLTTVVGDLVLKLDQRYGTAPSLSAGWTSAQTTTNADEGARLSYISATGTSTTCNSEDEDYSSVVAIAIPAGEEGGSSIAPLASRYFSMMRSA